MSPENRPACANNPQTSNNLYPPYARVKHCGQCGAEFLCGPTEDNGDCWCDRLPNVVPLLTPEEGCLCKRCLQVVIEQHLAEQTTITS